MKASKAKIRARDKTILAAFRGEANTREKRIPEKKIYSRKKIRAEVKALKKNTKG
jgi:hypothetical protein